MRRTDRELTDPQALRQILEDGQVLHVGYQDQEGLAVVPLNYGFVWEGDSPVLYVHSATQGRKVSAFQAGGQVALEIDVDSSLVESQRACGYSSRYRSVMAVGAVRLVEDPEEKLLGLQAIMEHYTKRAWSFPPESVERVKVFAIQVSALTGKQNL